MSKPFETDALNPSALPSAARGRGSRAASGSGYDNQGESSTSGLRYDQELKKFHDDWNIKIDREIKDVAGGLTDLIDLAQLRPTGPYQASPPILSN